MTAAGPVRADASSPVGLHRVLEPSGAERTLPQAAQRLGIKLQEA